MDYQSAAFVLENVKHLARHDKGRMEHRRCAIFVELIAIEISTLRQERHLQRMANIYIQVVFAVEGRQSLIKPEHNDAF